MAAQAELHLGFPKGENADRTRQARKVDRIIGLSGIGRQLTTEADRSAFVDGLTPRQFIDHLTTLDGFVLNLPRSEVKLAGVVQPTYDPSTGVFTDVMPAPEDKEFLLGEVLRIAQGVDNIQMKALILGYGTNAVHPFENGNGRVSRTEYSLLTRGHEYGNGEILNAMDPAGERGYQLDGLLFSSGAYQLLQKKLGTHTVISRGGVLDAYPKIIPRAKNPDIHPCKVEPANREWDEERMADMAIVFNNIDISTMVCYMLLNSYNSRSAGDARGKIGNFDVFYVDEFFRNATDKEIGYAYDAFRNIKRQHVLTMINTLAMNENTDIFAAGQFRDGRGRYSGPWPEIGLLVTEGILTASESSG